MIGRRRTQGAAAHGPCSNRDPHRPEPLLWAPEIAIIHATRKVADALLGNILDAMITHD